MTGPQLLVTCVLGSVILLLYFTRLSASVIFVSAAALLTIAGILSPGDALSGFGNDAIAVMMMLIAVSQVIRKTRIIDYLFEKRLRLAPRYRRFLAKMMPFVAGTSAFMNNTPIVAMIIPFTGEWGRRHGISASKLLIPLSYAAILGGMVTLIGTSTNLIVNGLAVGSGLERLQILDFTPVGLMMLVAGSAYLLLFGYRLLPERKAPATSFAESPREYLVEAVVSAGSPLAGKSVEKANLRSLKGLFLAEIIRDGETIAPVGPDEILEPEDVLILVGEIETVADLVKDSRGLAYPAGFQPPDHEKLDIVESVVTPRSELVDMRVKDTDFRSRYDAAILAVHRKGEKLEGKIGELVLEPGDLLLLVAGGEFRKRIRETEELYIISHIGEVYNIDFRKSAFIIGSTLACIGLSVAGLVPLFKSLLVLLAIFMITRIETLSELKRNLDFTLLTVAAFALALGRAVDQTGLGAALSEVAVEFFEPYGPIGILAAVYLVTNLLADFITTAAAASVVFPFAAATAASLGVDPKPFIIAVAYGAAANFITPIGYQTNLMIYGPGGYRFRDFMKVGLPLKIICAIVAIAGLGWVHGLI